MTCKVVLQGKSCAMALLLKERSYDMPLQGVTCTVVLQVKSCAMSLLLKERICTMAL